MKKIYILTLIFFLTVVLSSRQFDFKPVQENFHLKDGSIIRGELLENEPDSSDIKIKNEYLGEIAIDKSAIKFTGVNQVNGYLLGLVPFLDRDTKDDTKSGIAAWFSLAKFYDERISGGTDIQYMYRNFTKTSTKFFSYDIHDSDSTIDTLVNTPLNYKGNFLSPTFVIRFSVIPDKYKKTLDKMHFYPYLGIGVGYNLALVNYKPANNECIFADSIDVTYNRRVYSGINFKGLIGASYRVSTRSALVFELAYMKSEFNQILTSDEEKADMPGGKIIFESVVPYIGIRLGRF